MADEGGVELGLLRAINRVLHGTLACEDDEQVASVFLDEVERLTGSAFGWIGVVNDGGRLDTLAMSDPGFAACRLPDSEKLVAIRDMEIRGVWGAALRAGETLRTDDPSAHPDSVGTPEGHPPLTSFLGVPFARGSALRGMISLANKEGGYDEQDQQAVESIAVALVEALYRKRTEQQLARQAEELLAISTPVLEVSPGVLVAPLIGSLDRRRTEHFLERVLQAVVEHQAEVAFIDITGVPAVDTETAQYLIEATTAVRLLGSRVVLTGLRPAIAQTLVQLGVELGEIETHATLAGGLRALAALPSRGRE